jgi:hypothetical protein
MLGVKMCSNGIFFKYTVIIKTTIKFHNKHNSFHFDRNGAVGIVTGYRLDGQGSIPDMGKKKFSSPQGPDQLRLTQPPIQGVLATFPKGKAAGASS